MAASFASRLSNLRQKKLTQNEEESGQLRLTLPPDASQKSTYQPTKTFSNTRTSFRLLKGRIERGQSSQKQEITTNIASKQTHQLTTIQKLSLPESGKESLKLTLNDDTIVEDKKQFNQPPKVPLQKRILISKETPQEEVKRQTTPPPPEIKKTEIVEEKKQREDSQKIISQNETPIREEEAEESLPPESELDLILCPEGCGRKFNRKALEKHVKACKVVFMSKRKEFNSQAKRITSKEQATLVKKQKIDEKKKMGMTRNGFDKMKTGQNWKAASQDFRNAVKAMKKEEKDEEEEQANVDELEGKKVVNIMCKYCEKMFNEVFIEKHMENCTKKKQKEKKKTTKK